MLIITDKFQKLKYHTEAKITIHFVNKCVIITAYKSSGIHYYIPWIFLLKKVFPGC